MTVRYVWKRLWNIVFILLLACAYTALVCTYFHVWADEAILLFVITAMFFVLFLFFLEHKRRLGRIEADMETNFGKVTLGFALSALIMLSGLFLPEFLRPAMAAAVCLSAFSEVDIALSVNLFFCVILGLGAQFSVYEFILYAISAVFGCIIAEALEEQKFMRWYYIIIFCTSLLLPELFFYLTYQQISSKLLLFGAVEGILLNLLIYLFHSKITEWKKHSLEKKYKKIMDESYPLAAELAGFSKAEFSHAKKVSQVASLCAKTAGASEHICAAAGFYYRIGIIEGDEIAKNGISLVYRDCFPRDVIRIIEEYNGEFKKPSTPESAIVHIVDGLIKKLEAFGKETTMSSDWNQDMVIYQTLNEFSASGIYDQSGLSMNRFLQIRECLVKASQLI